MNIEAKYDENTLNTIGDNLAGVLGMRREKELSAGRIRWKTIWGTKTGLGLLRTLSSNLLDIEFGSVHSDLTKGIDKLTRKA